MGIRVLHTGDLHIGNFPGPEKDGENVRFLDICRCLDALVAGAREQQPDIAVIAGDIFHQARVWRRPGSQGAADGGEVPPGAGGDLPGGRHAGHSKP